MRTEYVQEVHNTPSVHNDPQKNTMNENILYPMTVLCTKEGGKRIEADPHISDQDGIPRPQVRV